MPEEKSYEHTQHHEHEHHHEHKEHHTEHKDSKGITIKKSDAWKIATALAVLLLIISIFTGGFRGNKEGIAGVVSADKAAQSALNYINNNLLQPGTSAALKDVSESSGVYSIGISVGGQDYTSYVTQDGKMLFVSGVDMTQKIEEPATEPEQPQDIPKSDKPKVELFVWAFCPGGISGENTLYPAVELLGKKIDSKVVFIGPVTEDKQEGANSCFAGRGKEQEDALKSCCATYDYKGKKIYSCALHNSEDNLEESYESARQACIMDNYDTKTYWKYLNAYNSNCLNLRTDKTNYNECINGLFKDANIDSKKINSCMSSDKVVELLIADSKRADELGIQSSPTLYINGAEFSGSRTADSWKQGICSAFNTAPEECGNAVTASQTSTNSNAQCG